MSPLATYAHGRKATRAEIKGKSEDRYKGGADLRVLKDLQKGNAPPALETFDPGGSSAHSPAAVNKMLRDITKMSRGGEDFSEFELSSDESYSEDVAEEESEEEVDEAEEPPRKKQRRGAK